MAGLGVMSRIVHRDVAALNLQRRLAASYVRWIQAAMLNALLHVQVLDTQLRPIFESIDFGLNLLNRLKAGLFELVFAGLNFAGRELHDVYDSEMDSADIRCVVIDKSDDSLLAFAGDAYFLVEFSLHAGPVPVVAPGIFDGNMPADSN